MRPGPARGESATLEVTVDPSMTAKVAGREIHPVYGTGALVQHMEEVCRQLLVPHLEEGEEGVGYSIEAQHRHPVPAGETILLTASVATVGPKRLVCEVLVRQGTLIVARGTFEQRVVDLEEFRTEVAARTTT